MLQGRAEQGYVVGETPPSTFLNLVGSFTKCVGKISRPVVIVKFGVFYRKKTKCRILSISYPAKIKLLPAMVAFKEVI